jgi:beta-lysine 5,6-aminomutase beta subunit
MLMGISNPLIAHAESIDPKFTFFVIYGASSHTIDPTQVLVNELAHTELDFYEVNELIEKRLARHVTVVGAAIAKELGYDAGFGPGTTVLSVASCIAQELVARI